MRGETSIQTIKTYLAQGQWNKVVSICSQALKSDPSLLELYPLLGKALAHQGKLAAAIAAYQQILGTQLERAEIHAELGILHGKQQELVKAAWHYQQALAYKPDWAELHYNLAVVLHQIGDWEAAITAYRQAIAIKPNYAAAYFNLGVLQDCRGELEEAIENYHQAINLQPNYVKAYSNLGSTLVKQKKYTAAIEIYQQGLKLDPSWATLHNNLGQVFWFNEQPERALTSFEYAIALEPKMALAYHNLGKLWQQQGNYPAAIECFQRTIELEPRNIWAYSHCANALLVRGQLELAMEYLREAIALQPYFIKAYCQRAKLLEGKDLLEKAKIACAHFLEALQQKGERTQLYQHLWQTYYYLGDILFEYGGIQQAKIYYQQALQIKPDEVELYLRSGNCLAKQQRLDAAVTIYHMGLNLQPNHPQICFQLGKILERQQQAEAAIDYYETVLRQQLSLGADEWGQLPHLFPLDEHLAQLPHAIYYHTQDWIRDCELDDFHYTQVSWGDKYLNQTSVRKKQPDSIFPFTAKKKPEPECGGVNCASCMSKLIDYFEPVQLGKNTYVCSPLNSPPIASPLPFVVTIPEGRVWIAPQQNSWMICNALAVITPDGYLLGDVSRYYPWYLPGCPYQERNDHTFLSLEEIPPVEEIDGTVAVLSGLAGHVYYHWMIDIIPRIELLRRSEIDLEQIDWFLINNIDQPFQRETLTLLGIPLTKILPSDRYSHVRAKELIVPSFPGHLDWVSPGTIQFLRQTFLPQIPKNNYPERIYISRARARGRQVINENEVINVLNNWGFQTIFLEEMSLLQQAALFANAKVIVAPHGSSLTNLVFCSPETKIVELFSPHYVRTDYWILSQQLQLQHYYSVGQSFDCYPLRHLMYQNSLTEDIFVDLGSLRLIMRLAGIAD
ncbi:tetratricopeptide repeat protein [Pleurocapsales cyanobacterium LEGE 06147]|nr:tetratricopeptide repeat protein [Pleurocapsales cyanobacterium LEGE 06147]